MESMQPKARNTGQHKDERADQGQAQLRHAFEDAGRHLDADRTGDAGPRHARMIEQARHQIAIDRCRASAAD